MICWKRLGLEIKMGRSEMGFDTKAMLAADMLLLGLD